MKVYSLDDSLVKTGLIEDYFSLIWTERYNDVGDFELELPITYDLDKRIDLGGMLILPNSDRVMLIQDIKPQTGRDRTSLLVTGESFETVLKERVTLGVTHLDGVVTAETEIYSLISAHITNPILGARDITIVNNTLPTPSITATHTDIYDPGSLYKIITAICEATGLGFKFELNSGLMKFSVYEGVDRSYSQDPATNPFVIFSPAFGNVISSSYYESILGLVNAVLVLTDDGVYPSTWVYETDAASPQYYSRKEEVLETTIDRTVSLPNLTDAEVLAIIKVRGREIIRERKQAGLFEGDFDITGNFVYGTDFYLGDIVECKIENRTVSARLAEVTTAISQEGITTYAALDFVL